MNVKALDSLERARQFVELLKMSVRETSPENDAIGIGLLTVQSELDRVEAFLRSETVVKP